MLELKDWLAARNRLNDAIAELKVASALMVAATRPEPENVEPDPNSGWAEDETGETGLEAASISFDSLAPSTATFGPDWHERMNLK